MSNNPSADSFAHIDIYADTTTKIPAVSGRDQPKFHSAVHRTNTAQAFTQGADTYQDIRPGYPDFVVDTLSATNTAIDIGAGTGKLTAALCASEKFTQITALDPSMDMLNILRTQLPKVHTLQATAEHTGLTQCQFETLTCAQSWHWVDPLAASAELARISTADAQFLLVWNTLDVSIPWVHRLSRIMHSGDTLKPDFVPPIAKPWMIHTTIRDTWSQALVAQDLHRLAHTRSYWLRANEQSRQRLTKNLDWYLYEHLGLTAHSPVSLPYRVDAFYAAK
ncbi:class I SAM-dependent methyltransferase [Corynebacterium sp. HS2168-gen11]|uniref:class I SAM-dependent methyltransferase n=1 Tax=Corynebacterium sp. HS2168-gen11 TaxID=2974027 RepID=UPI00216B2257|nr:class I SAM-dependent methyltransferase [Corynebacterium sp. HS2168-gen11]MCS4535038.1 class I SAM-dependent methyltransferase [Corynebacterium sp. HS2168-gen11]